ncbi:MAG: AAA family ATPase [Clostridia bacterium]|nr:AAA family ATPase [Clostridia bacterium]
MKLLSLHIENFGTLQDFDLVPSEGLNVLYQKNGWGKSTLAVFIKAMFYGLPATTKRSLDDNERKKYSPWQGGAFGGSIEFSTEKGSFRAERFFGAKESADTFALYDLSTNKPSDAYSAALGEELFGIDAEGFERSTYLSQRTLTGNRDNNSISAKLGNLLDDVGDIGNYDTAVAALDKRRKHYVMTGNRGAIAEMEQEQLELQKELEHARSIESALTVQQEQLFSCVDELAAARKLSEETRARLENAGLARERAALVEQRKSMERDLEGLRAKYAQTDRFFRGATPTVEEWRSYCDLFDSLKEVKAQRNLFASAPQYSDRLKSMRQSFSAGVPTETILSRMSQDADAMRDMRSRAAALKEQIESDAPFRRFPNGVPSERTLDKTKERLQSALNARAEVQKVQAENPPHKPLMLAGGGVLVLGVLFAILGFAISSAMTVLLILAGILLAGGGVALWMGMKKRDAYLRQCAEAEAQKQRRKTEADENLRSVCAFLREYRMPCDDPMRALTELTLLSAQYRDALAKREQMREELNALETRFLAVSERLRTGLSRYLGELPQKSDYRTELEDLRREVAAYLQLEASEKKRLADFADAEQRIAELSAELKTFLVKYDPMGAMSEGDCLQMVGEQRAERSRLSREILQKEQAIKQFVAEKKLTADMDISGAEDYDRLRAEETELQRRIEELQKKHATLKNSIERLSMETDRIPEMEARAVQLAQELRTARANSATVANAQKFLEEAKNGLSTRYLDGMQDAFRKFFEILTEGQAPESVMDTSFAVSLREGGKTRTLESFSRGWRDAVDFCIRLSLAGALYAEGEKPFLLLDDPFVNLDDKRLDAAKNMLEKLSEEYQIFYFVCHKERI